MEHLYLKLAGAFVCACIIFYVMLRIEAKNQKARDREFERVMKSLQDKADREKQNELASKQDSDPIG